MKRDAAFNDLVDALPLAGQYACLKVILEPCKNREELELLVTEGCEDRTQLSNKILKNENRVEQSLEDAYCDRLCEFVVPQKVVS